MLDSRLMFDKSHAITVTSTGSSVIDLKALMGEGVNELEFILMVTTAATAGSTATLTVSVTEAPDSNGSGGQAVLQVGPFSITSITSGPTTGLFAGDELTKGRIKVGRENMRYLILTYTVGKGPFTALTMTSGIHPWGVQTNTGASLPGMS